MVGNIGHLTVKDRPNIFSHLPRWWGLTNPAFNARWVQYLVVYLLTGEKYLGYKLQSVLAKKLPKHMKVWILFICESYRLFLHTVSEMKMKKKLSNFVICTQCFCHHGFYIEKVLLLWNRQVHFFCSLLYSSQLNDPTPTINYTKFREIGPIAWQTFNMQSHSMKERWSRPT